MFALPADIAGLDVTAPKRIALLVGNGAYPQAGLENPGRDVARVRDALGHLGFEVTVLEDIGYFELRTAIVKLAARAEAAGPSAIAFFFFAGHAVHADGQPYLLPVDAVVESPPDVRSCAVPISFIFAELGKARAAANIIVIDACRTVVGEGAPDVPVKQDISGWRMPDPTLVVYSTASSATAEDGRNGGSPFALALTEQLRQPVKLEEVFRRVTRSVALATKRGQTPARYTEGDLPDLSLCDPHWQWDEDAADRSAERARGWPGRLNRTLRALTLARPRRFAAVGLALPLLALLAWQFVHIRPPSPSTAFALPAAAPCCEPSHWRGLARAGHWPGVQEAARRADPTAQLLLGAASLVGFAEAGVSIPQDLERAQDLLRQAATRDARAALILAGLMERGGPGLAPDRAEARELYEAARRSPTAWIKAAAEHALRALNQERELSRQDEARFQVEQGDQAAPVVVTLYMSLNCQGCAPVIRDALQLPRRIYPGSQVHVRFRPWINRAHDKLEEHIWNTLACLKDSSRADAVAVLAEVLPAYRRGDLPDEMPTSLRERIMVSDLVNMHMKEQFRVLASSEGSCPDGSNQGLSLSRLTEAATTGPEKIERPSVYVNGYELHDFSLAGLVAEIDRRLPIGVDRASWLQAEARPPVAPAPPLDPKRRWDPDVQIVNRSSRDIEDIEITSPGRPMAPIQPLRGLRLVPGSAIDVELPRGECLYDVRVTFSDNARLTQRANTCAIMLLPIETPR